MNWNWEPRTWKTSVKLLLGLVTIWPIIYIFVMHLGAMLLMFVLMPLYILLAVKNESHDQTMKIVWIVLMATTGILVMPVYWYLFVWRKSPSETAVPVTL